MNSSLMLRSKTVQPIKKIADFGGSIPPKSALLSPVTANRSTDVAGVPRRFRWKLKRNIGTICGVQIAVVSC